MGFSKKMCVRTLEEPKDYCVEQRALIHNLVPRYLFQTSECTPYEFQFGTQGDISNLCSFSWYEWCYYREEGGNTIFPNMKEVLGGVLGPSKNEGNDISATVSYILVQTYNHLEIVNSLSHYNSSSFEYDVFFDIFLERISFSILNKS